MSTSHPLRPLFMTFEPVAHPLLPIVVAMVPLFFPTVSEALPSDWNIHLLRGPKRSPAICNSTSNLLKLAANTKIASTSKKNPILPCGKTAWGVVKWVLVVKTEGENSNPRYIDLSCNDKRFATTRGAWTSVHQFDVVK